MSFTASMAACVTALALAAPGQVSIRPTPRRTSQARVEGCETYLLSPPRPRSFPPFSRAASESNPDIASIEACASSLRDELERFEALRRSVKSSEKTAPEAAAEFFEIAGGKGGRASLVVQPRQLAFNDASSVSLYLMKAHSLYKYLKRRAGQARGGVSQAVERDLRELGERVHELMSSEGLQEAFAALLDTGIALADSGGARVRPARDSSEAQARGVVGWESRHFGEDGARAHFSLGGSLGFAPTMVLVRTGGSESTPQTIFQHAFVWDFMPRLSFPAGDGEAALFGRWGQSRLTGDPEAFQRGEDTVVAVRIANDTGRIEHFLETGVEYKLYNRPLDVIHHEKDFLLPAFSLALGYRMDNRLRAWGNAFGDLSARPDRMFYRMSVSLNRIANLTQKDILRKEPISIRFSVDHDRPLRGSQVPPATRLIFGGDVDLVKAFRGQ
jgi:hypothetical protein